MQSRKRTRLRPAEGWPKDWYYSGEVDTVNIEALLAPDEFFNRVILGRTDMTKRKAIDPIKDPVGAYRALKRSGRLSPELGSPEYMEAALKHRMARLKPRPEAEEARPPDSTSAPRREPKA